jgi:hypothetical protein
MRKSGSEIVEVWVKWKATGEDTLWKSKLITLLESIPSSTARPYNIIDKK